MRIKLTEEKFKNKSNEIHGFEEYDYIESKINGVKNYVWITHNKCRHRFQQTPNNHMRGKGCPKCFGTPKSNIIEFLIKLFLKFPHNISLYGYWNSKYIDAKTTINIFCFKCNDYFEQSPNNHIKGTGCHRCGTLSAANKITLNTIDFLIKLFIKFPQNISLYGYEKLNYINNNILIKIFCYKCNDYFQQTPNNHMQGQGCPNCKSSTGEKEINKILIYNNIKFETQKKFKDCKNERKLPFDFYLTNYNVLIEYDGKQHFEPTSFGTDQSIETKQKNLILVEKRDQIKTQYCKENNIKLIRINYKQNIEEELTKLFIDLLKL